MKRTVLIALTLILGFPAPLALAQSADELVARGLEALGGVEKLKSLQSRRLSGQITFLGGAQGRFTSIQQRPNRLRFEAEVMGSTIIQAYDGEEAWQIQPAMAGGSGQAELIPAEQAEAILQRSDFDGFLLDYREKGHQIELVGEEEWEGKPVYHLKLTPKQGSDLHYFMDAQTYLVHKTVMTLFNPMSGSKDEFELLTSDYRQIDGIQMAHSIKTVSAGTVFNQLSVEKIEFNVETDPHLFSRPDPGSE